MQAKPVVVGTVVLVFLTTVVSGPLVPLVDITADRSFSGDGLGEGRASVGDVTLPGSVAFERGDFGSGSYYLRVDPATIELDDVVGRPIVSYEVSIPALGYSRSAVTVLSSADEGTYELSIDEAAFGPEEITNESYAGELVVDARYGEAEYVLARKNVTIEVIG